jgi:tetratricopeptide (TPR) repeat protein
LAADLASIEAMIRLGLADVDPSIAIKAAIDLAGFLRFSGIGIGSLIEEARDSARIQNDAELLANCIQRLGDIALRRSDHDAARSRYEEALPLYRRIADVLGEANCILGLGNIALERTDHEAAHSRYDEALPLYRRIGSVLGEANCIQSKGDIAVQMSDYDTAQAQFKAALTLYEHVHEPYSIGLVHRRLARIARNDTERRIHLETAWKSWASIDRPDLVKELDAEFPPPILPPPKRRRKPALAAT